MYLCEPMSLAVVTYTSTSDGMLTEYGKSGHIRKHTCVSPATVNCLEVLKEVWGIRGPSTLMTESEWVSYDGSLWVTNLVPGKSNLFLVLSGKELSQ